ncbi:hypothetical protein YC2023_060777 [Brassica napus]|uniref:Secreted protein n=2 Tax=Brassica oleracea TaxID=3712 RepID=A0A0D3CGQ3_BRAOL|nr:unnamed protein product [Brassica oleracea]
MFRFWRRGSILMLATLGRIFSGYRNRKGWIGRSIAQHTRGCGLYKILVPLHLVFTRNNQQGWKKRSR